MEGAEKSTEIWRPPISFSYFVKMSNLLSFVHLFLKEEAMVKEIIRLKLDELQQEVEQKISERMKHGRGPEPPSVAELVKTSLDTISTKFKLNS